MNQLNANNNVRQIKQPRIKSTQLETMPSLGNNNILSENDEYCYELDQSTYSKISRSNKSKKSNNSNTIQMISELSDLSIDNNEPLEYINHLPVIKNNEMKNKSININKCKNNKNKKKKKLELDLDNYDKKNNISNHSQNSSDDYEMNEINLHNNKELNIDNDDLDNEWNVPKITFSEISKVSKAISSEGNEEGLVDNDDFYTNNNNTNNIKIIKENINTKKNTQKKHENNYINNDLNTIANNGRHIKNIESKFSMDENCKTINLLSSQISNMDYLKQTLNNCLLKSGYKEVIDNSQKFMTKSSSLDFLNEYSNIKPESENIKKNLIMQMVLFTNMKNEMEILKKENDNLARIINVFKNEHIKNENIKEELLNENKKLSKEVNHLKNKIKKYKDYYKNKDGDGIKNEYKTLIKKNEQLIINNEIINTENKKLKEELIKLKKIKKEFYNEKNDNDDKKEKELINNRINIILQDNNNLNEVINKQKIHIENLVKKINKQKLEISNYIEKIRILQEENDSRDTGRKRKYRSKFKYLEEKNDNNKENNLLFLNINDYNNIENKNENIENDIIKQNLINNKNIQNKMQNNLSTTINHYKNKLQEKNKIIEKMKSEIIKIKEQNESKEKRINELLKIENDYNIIETQNNEIKKELKELNIKYTGLIDENNKINKIKNNLMEQLEKLNQNNKQKESEIINFKEKIENIKKKISSSNNALIEFAKKLKIYANKEFQRTNMNLFLKGFKELIEKLNNQKFDENLEELKGIGNINDFINLIPLEIEILYKRIITLQKDRDNSATYHSTRKSVLNNNNDKAKNINKINMYPNAFTDMPANKKMSKYKGNDNTLYFRNKEIKIKKLNITDLANNFNSVRKSNKNSKNKYIETEKLKSDNVNSQKYSNLITETIKSSRSDNFKKITKFHTIQSNNENGQKANGINLKKFSFSKNNEETIGNKNLDKKDNNSINHKEILSSRRSISKNENNSGFKSNNKNDERKINNYSEKNEFKSIRNKIINNGFHLQSSIKKNIPQRICFFLNEKKAKNNINIKQQLLKSDISLSGTGDATGNTNNFAYKKKILHKTNNFSVNIKDGKKNKISFNSSTSSSKKKNNSFALN
jgi:hypothetical protein